MTREAAGSVMTEGHSLNPSELGTKEYWDNVYHRELQNFGDDENDEGTNWFSESNAEQAVIRQLAKLHNDGLLIQRHGPEDEKVSVLPSRFLDLGTGNGHMLLELREEDDEGESWAGEMVGVDYSEASVQLARRIAQQRYSEHQLDGGEIVFERWDLLHDQAGKWLANGFDVVLDKGTFDAISLMGHPDGSEHPCVTYREKVTQLIKASGFLLVTSCNFSKEELVEWLAPDGGSLVYFDEAKYPTFTFGGKTGQTVVTIVFRKDEAPK